MTALALERLPVISRGAMMRAAEAEIKDKSYQRTPIGMEVKHFLETLRFEGSPATTINTYELPLAWLALDFDDFSGASQFCDDQGVQLLRDFMRRHWNETAPETKRNRLAVLRSFFGWMVLERGIPHNPAARIKAPRASEPLRIARLRQETERLVDAQETLRDRCALELMVRLGLRRNDLRMLQIRDIDLTREVVFLRHRKGDHSLMLPIGYQWLAENLYLHIQGEGREPGEYLVYPKKRRTEPFSATGIHLWFKRCLENADLADFPMHELRHTAGTEIYLATGNIVIAQQLLGHKSLETTRRYIHPSDQDLRAGQRAVADEIRSER